MSGPRDHLRRLAGRHTGDRAVIVGAVLSVAWLVLVLIFWVLSPVADEGAGGLARLMTVVAVLLPVVLIWTAVTLARGIAVLRAEAQ
ncbi:MAG: hypothetical protein P3W90_003685, partial [Paracoccus sp. (in: a-proteobacteria)]|nr:hypothetical protein [Paracoccus sp. (in: a-proteobacteria)]